MQGCVERDQLSGGATIGVAPSVEQSVRIGESYPAGFLPCPLPAQQCTAHVADMTKAGFGRCRQIGDTPCSLGIAQHDTEDVGRFRTEQRLQVALFRGRPAGDAYVDQDAGHVEERIAVEIEVADVMVDADRS